MENLKKDKIYIDNLISELKEKYPESEKKTKVNYDDEDEYDYPFSEFNKYYNEEFLVYIDSLIEFIEILLKNYHPGKLNENLSITLESFIYYRKINKLNFEKFEKNDKWCYFE